MAAGGVAIWAGAVGMAAEGAGSACALAGTIGFGVGGATVAPFFDGLPPNMFQPSSDLSATLRAIT